MFNSKALSGRKGEALAAEFLKKNGYRIIALNYRTKLGEIDIIAEDKPTLCFIEVKLRSSDRFGLPQEAVSPKKQAQIAKAALLFLKENRLIDKDARFDIVAVLDKGGQAAFELIKNAFELNGEYSY